MADSKWQDMKKLLTAWQGVWRSRCCPPVQALSDQSHGMLQEHLALCPWCREAVRTGSFRAAASVADRLRALSEGARLPTPSPGMIFFINPSLGAWGRGGRYINPPAVLVISPPEKSLVTVAQVCAASIFTGPGDIPIGNGLHGYAQAWNTYMVNPRDFSMLAADTGDASVRAVTDAMIDLSGADGPAPGSIAWFYRQIELETGRFISQKSCAHADPVHEFPFISPEQLASDLENSGFTLPRHIEVDASPDQIILMAEPPAELMPLAAAAGESIDSGISISALVFLLGNGRVKEIKSIPATITFSEYAGGVYRVTGRIDVESIPELVQAKLHWLIKIDTGAKSLQPIAGMSGSQGSMFWAAFTIPDAGMIRPADLKIRITAHEPSELAGTSHTP